MKDMKNFPFQRGRHSSIIYIRFVDFVSPDPEIRVNIDIQVLSPFLDQRLAYYVPKPDLVLCLTKTPTDFLNHIMKAGYDALPECCICWEKINETDQATPCECCKRTDIHEKCRVRCSSCPLCRFR